MPADVTFASGETERSITFSAADDTVDDDGESVQLGFGTPLPERVSAADYRSAAPCFSITDDDVPSSLTVDFGSSSYSVTEGGNVEVTVTLSDDPEQTVVIPLTATAQDGATGDDYSGVPADVTFSSGETEQSFIFGAATDSDNDDGESVKLGFENLPRRRERGEHCRGRGRHHRADRRRQGDLHPEDQIQRHRQPPNTTVGGLFQGKDPLPAFSHRADGRAPGTHQRHGG